MLSYRHGYHAGSPADVLKHAVFAYTLRHALRKETPLYVLDSHAGAGLYDLTSPMAEKLGEFRSGILPVLRAPEPAPALLSPYLELVRQANPGRQLTVYPGSAALAAQLLRQGDHLELIELHPSDYDTLARHFGGARAFSVALEPGDALQLLPTRLPPREGRGIVFIDPSFELKTDYHDIVEALLRGHRRFGHGTFILWYPVIDRSFTDQLVRRIRDSSLRKVLQLELGLLPDAAGRGMTGSGLLVINPPWTLEVDGRTALRWLATVLGGRGEQVVRWLVPE